MRYLIIVILALSTVGLVNFDHSYDKREILKKGIVDTGYYFDNKFYVVHNGEDYKFSVLDSNFEILYSYIRDGEGPGEARKILGTYVDTVNEEIYVLKNAGILMVFNRDFELINQFNFGKQINASDIIINKNRAYFSVQQFYFPKQSNGQINILSYIDLDDKDYAINKFSISINDLNIKNKNRFENLEFARFTSRINRKGNQIFVGLTGYPKIHVFDINKSAIVDEIEIPRYTNAQFEVVKHPQHGYGLRTPPINNSITIKDKFIYVAHGNTHVEMKPTLLKYNLQSNEWGSIKDFESSVTTPVVNVLGNKLSIHEYYEQMSNYLEITEWP